MKFGRFIQFYMRFKLRPAAPLCFLMFGYEVSEILCNQRIFSQINRFGQTVPCFPYDMYGVYWTPSSTYSESISFAGHFPVSYVFVA